MADEDAKAPTTTHLRPVIAATGDALVPCLEVVRGGDVGTLHPLRGATLTVGRDPDCTISANDGGLSRRHAKIVVGSDGVAQFVDLGSTNGSYVNGEAVEAAVLRGGETLQLGPDLVLRFGFWPEEAVASTGRGPPEAAKELRLSPRELSVARLVAEGLSNAEVATRLGISARTVGAHLGNIYARLDIHTRAQLTRWIVEQGLL